MSLESDHYHVSTQYYEQYSQMGDDIGFQVPSPKLGQSVNEYRCTVLRDLKKTFLPPDNKYHKINYLRDLRNDSTALNIIEPQMLAEVKIQARNPMNVPRGEIREIKVRDPATGRISHHEFIGQDSFVKGLGRPCRRVLSFSQPLQTIVKYGDRGLLP
jgi:hypothetical protein